MPKNNLLLPTYAKYLFRTPHARREIKEKSSYTTRALTSGSLLNHVKLLFPPTKEQCRIVAVLEAWDMAIEKLGRKIEIKRNIKKGLMQDLLTGKKRLGGFKGEWKLVRLGDISKMGSGGTPKTTNESYFGGNIPWVSIADMTASGKYIYSTFKNLSEAGWQNSAAKIYPKGTILYAMYASIGECSITGTEMASSQAILGIIPNKEKLDFLFLYFYLCSIKEIIRLQGQQGTQSNLNAGIVRNFRLKIPEVKEQNVIANILTTADKEITELEKKLGIIKAQKNYLLNNLITGAIRTPEKLSRGVQSVPQSKE
jgi:type I restriction enzyme S subunit